MIRLYDSTQFGAEIGVAARTIYDWWRRKILPQPVEKRGNMRLWSHEQVQDIKAKLEAGQIKAALRKKELTSA